MRNDTAADSGQADRRNMAAQVLDKDTTVRPFINNEHIGQYLEMGSESLHYIEEGRGDTIILVHSEGQSLFTWHEIFYALAEHFHVVAIDLFGHGYSSVPDIEFTIRQHSETLREFMAVKEIEKAHIIAFSLGAVYALDFVQQNPGLCSKLTLISPGGITPQMPMFVRMMDSALLNALAGLLFSEKKVRDLLTDCFFDRTLVTEQIIAQYYIPLSNRENLRVISTTLQNFDEEEVLTNLRNVEQETLILWGADDKWHPPEMLTVFQMAMKRCEVVQIRNCGHLLHEEKPERCVELLLAFLGVEKAEGEMA